ncbi:MAG TPA: hypothetical protein VIL44_05735 [Micromonospora sp.]
MGYRDWGYGDGSSYERRASTSWVDQAERTSADARPATERSSWSYLSTSWGDDSGSSRLSRDVESIIADVDDAYWRPPKAAAVHIPHQVGRHRADDDDDDGQESHAHDSSRAGTHARHALVDDTAQFDDTARTVAGRHRLTSETTGYDTARYAVTSNSADSATRDDIGSTTRRARATTRDSTGYGTSVYDTTEYDTTSYRTSDARRTGSTGATRGSSRRSVADESAAEGASRLAPVSPAVDWRSDPTASWDRPPVDTGEWRTMPETDEWERSEDTGEWMRVGHTSEWRNPYAQSWTQAQDSDAWGSAGRARDWRDTTSAGQWQRAADTGQFDRIISQTSWDSARGASGYATATSGTDRQTRSGRRRRTTTETAPSSPADTTFWSGTRLAPDDPRWVETPSTAPRSPAVSAPRSPAGSYPRPPVSSLTRPQYRPPLWRRTDRFDEELLDYDPGGYVPTLIYTTLWFLLPIVLLGLWTLTLDNTPPPPGCVTDANGGGCQSERAAAIASLARSIPQFGVALVASLIVAIVLRWTNGTWRAVSLGLAAAVIGGGLSTVLFTALTG